MLNTDYFLGFDNLMKQFENVNKITKYPPHNVLKLGDGGYLIEIAIAGFSKGDISLEKKDKTLKISGKRVLDRDDSKYVFKGISSKDFEKRFVLGDYMNVISAKILDGILRISLEQVLPEEKKPVTIEID